MQLLHALEEVGDWQVAAAILAHERAGDALTYLARRIRMVVEAAGGVAVHIDESWRDDTAGHIDDSLARARRQVLLYLDDGVARDADVGGPRRSASAVHDLAVLDEQGGRLR
jgi:hypothetical protein